MRNALYITTVILALIWIIGCMRYNQKELIHASLIVALFSLLLGATGSNYAQ